MLLQQVMRAFSKQSSAVVFSDTVVVSEKFINDCTELFSELMHQKAEKVCFSSINLNSNFHVKIVVSSKKMGAAVYPKMNTVLCVLSPYCIIPFSILS